MADFREGQTATNPKTGQKIVFRDGDWHAAAVDPSAPAPEPQLSGNARNQALQKIKSLQALRRQAVLAATMYNKNFSRESGRSSVAEYLPAFANGTNAQYDAAIDGLMPLARAAFRVYGSGADSDQESQTFMNVVPTRYTNDYGAKQKYQQMLSIIDGSIADQNSILGVKPRAQAAPAPSGRMGQFKVIR